MRKNQNEMQIFGTKGSLGAKAENIIELYKNGFHIPETYVIQKGYKQELNPKDLDDRQDYILRPSYCVEDGKENSYAGFFTSIYPLSYGEIQHHIEQNFDTIVPQKFKEQLKSIIIQPFVEADFYGVYFSRSPDNIFQKGYYEIGEKNDDVTSGKAQKKVKLSYLQTQELEYIGKSLEKIFHFPVDIEFAVQKNSFVILQCRPITTGNNSIYSFEEIHKFTGIYQKIDFDEFGEKSDIFSYIVLSQLFECILIRESIYFKKKILPNYLYKKTTTSNTNLQSFYDEYQKYLRQKIYFSITRLFIPQKLNSQVLKKLFQTYKYSFLQKEKSNLQCSFSYSTNFITRKFLKIEQQKQKAFHYLEKHKEEFLQNNNTQETSKYGENSTKLIIRNGVILNSQKVSESEYVWIYKGKIDGYITKIEDIKKVPGLSQVLILESLDIRLYEVIKYISGIIIKNGVQLSHNSIILREYKIPSVIHYTKFADLKLGERISLG